MRTVIHDINHTPISVIDLPQQAFEAFEAGRRWQTLEDYQDLSDRDKSEVFHLEGIEVRFRNPGNPSSEHTLWHVVLHSSRKLIMKKQSVLLPGQTNDFREIYT